MNDEFALNEEEVADAPVPENELEEDEDEGEFGDLGVEEEEL